MRRSSNLSRGDADCWVTASLRIPHRTPRGGSEYSWQVDRWDRLWVLGGWWWHHLLPLCTLSTPNTFWLRLSLSSLSSFSFFFAGSCSHVELLLHLFCTIPSPPPPPPHFYFFFSTTTGHILYFCTWSFNWYYRCDHSLNEFSSIWNRARNCKDGFRTKSLMGSHVACILVTVAL